LLPWSFSFSFVWTWGWTLVALVHFTFLSSSSNYYYFYPFFSPQARVVATMVLISLLKFKLLLPWSFFFFLNSSHYYHGPSFYPLLELKFELFPTLVLLSFSFPWAWIASCLGPLSFSSSLSLSYCYFGLSLSPWAIACLSPSFSFSLSLNRYLFWLGLSQHLCICHDMTDASKPKRTFTSHQYKVNLRSI
jgi:hypothetical protein